MGSDPTHVSADGATESAAQRYAARRVYLTEDDEGALFGGTTPEPMGRTLKPPVLFMSRRQARADSALRAHRANKSTEADPLRGVRGTQAGEKKPLVNRRTEAAARANKRKSENKREGMRKAELSPKGDPANWRRVKEAGVWFWINDVTGVATDECPHESLRPPRAARKRSMPLEGSIAGDGSETLPECLDIDFDGQEEGTGALVYDSSEFRQAMRLLDGGLPSQAAAFRAK
ncbi:unnamed protein product [Ectocarpus sp. 6 AP-2014]